MKNKDSLQTVIVSKSLTKSRAKAEKIARKHAARIYTSRETKTSFRFRQRPPKDFVKGSFRTFQIPGSAGVSLVYGKLNPNRNPSLAQEDQLERRYTKRASEVSDLVQLAALAKEVESTEFDRKSVKDRLRSRVVDAVYRLNVRHAQLACTRGQRDFASDERCFYSLLRFPSEYQVSLFENPGKPIRLNNPTAMPNPGPCADLGTLLEFKFKNGRDQCLWDHEGEDFLFMWSPKYKAVVCVKNSEKRRQPKVSRKGGAAKMYERFSARPASNTFEVDIPKCKLQKLGKAVHIVYRSDKWSEQRNTTDYIHDFGNGVQLFCGPSLKNPEVFMCFGGKLTCTERGLVF